jgi:hypothetical protein
VKDPALASFDGGWVMLFSRVDRAGTWRIGMTRSRDLRTWSAFETMPHDVATGGEASPDVTRSPDGTYVVTYQSFPHDRAGSEAKLYARTTTDFRTSPRRSVSPQTCTTLPATGSSMPRWRGAPPAYCWASRSGRQRAPNSNTSRSRARPLARSRDRGSCSGGRASPCTGTPSRTLSSSI